MTGTGSKFYKRLNPEYKREIVHLEYLGNSPARWPKRPKEYGIKANAVFAGKGNLHPADEEVHRRDKRIKELEEENAILKKAMTVFAKDGK